MPGIQQLMKSSGKLTMILMPLSFHELLKLQCRTEAMGIKPCISQPAPVVEHIRRQRIREARGHKVSRPMLLPMREVAPMPPHLLVWIKRLEWHGGKIKYS